MLVEIGLMVGAYIVARALEMMVTQLRQFGSGLHGVLSVFVILASGIALVTAVFMSIALIIGGASVNTTLPGLPPR